MHGHLDQDIPLPVPSLACPGGKCWFLRASDAREDPGQNDLVVLNRELAAAILARGLPAPAPSLWEPRHPGVTGSGLKALGRQAFLGGAEPRKLCIQNHVVPGRRLTPESLLVYSLEAMRHSGLAGGWTRLRATPDPWSRQAASASLQGVNPTFASLLCAPARMPPIT